MNNWLKEIPDSVQSAFAAGYEIGRVHGSSADQDEYNSTLQAFWESYLTEKIEDFNKASE